MANARFRGDSRRREFYERRIEKALRKFEPRQRERIESVGWTKLKEYVHLLSRNERSRHHYEKWTAFAERDDVTVEIVQQAAERRRPSVPKDGRMTTVLLCISGELKQDLQDLIEALGRQGWKRNRRKAMTKLLRDADRGAR